MRRTLTLVLLTAGGLSAAGTAATAADTRDAASVIATLNAAGYARVRDVELDDGLWEAEVEGADGRWHDLHVVPATGEVLDPRRVGVVRTAADVRAGLEAQGYTRVRDLDLDEAVWDVEAVDRDGRQVDLRVHGVTGEVLVVEQDD